MNHCRFSPNPALFERSIRLLFPSSLCIGIVVPFSPICQEKFSQSYICLNKKKTRIHYSRMVKIRYLLNLYPHIFCLHYFYNIISFYRINMHQHTILICIFHQGLPILHVLCYTVTHEGCGSFRLHSVW